MLTLFVRGAARHLITPAVRKELRRQFGRALRAAALAEAEVCLSLTDDAELHELNRRYADEDHATDVLSFAQEQPTLGPAVQLPAGAGRVLGDILISLDTAARQAETAGHALQDELLHLSVHGLCHLLGHDHATLDEERVMFGYESLLRAQARGAGRVVKVPPPALVTPPPPVAKAAAKPASRRAFTLAGPATARPRSSG